MRCVPHLMSSKERNCSYNKKGSRAMKTFEIVNGKVMKGLPIVEGSIIVGRGYESDIVRVPIPDGALVEDGRIMNIPSKQVGSVILIRDHSGLNKKWRLLNARQKRARPEDIGLVIAKGRCLHSIGEQTSTGPEYLIAVYGHETFYIKIKSAGSTRTLRVNTLDDEIICVDIQAEKKSLNAERVLRSL